MNRQNRDTAAFERARALWNSTVLIGLRSDPNALWSDARIATRDGHVALLRSAIVRRPVFCAPRNAARRRNRAVAARQFAWVFSLLGAAATAGIAYLVFTSWR